MKKIEESNFEEMNEAIVLPAYKRGLMPNDDENEDKDDPDEVKSKEKMKKKQKRNSTNYGTVSSKDDYGDSVSASKSISSRPSVIKMG